MSLINREVLQSLNMRTPHALICTWFGCGLLKPAPGTWGTLGALPFGAALLWVGGAYALLAGIAVVIAVGLAAVARLQKETGLHDAGSIVIDEVAGVWITLLACTLSPLSLLLAFALFRIFDILKPWPVSWCDRKLSGAPGVMMDDIVAGIFAAIVLWGLHSYVGFE